MPKSTTKQPIEIHIRPIHIRLMFGTAIVLFAVFGVLWFQKVYTNPRRVFDGMLANNLSTAGVTKHTVSSQGGQKVDQYTQVSFVPPVASHSYVHLSQGTGDQATEVKSETIGTTDVDYSRYVSIATGQKSADGKKLDFSKVLGKWGKTDGPTRDTPSSAQYFRQAALGLLAFGNLDKSTRDVILGKLRDHKVYTVDYTKVKGQTVNGKRVFVYPVKIDLSAYVSVLKDDGKKVGLDVKDLDPEQYKGSPPVEITIAVDKLSRQVVQVVSGQDQKEDYVSYGLSSPVNTPDKTVPIAQLQQELQQIR